MEPHETQTPPLNKNVSAAMKSLSDYFEREMERNWGWPDISTLRPGWPGDLSEGLPRDALCALLDDINDDPSSIHVHSAPSSIPPNDQSNNHRSPLSNPTSHFVVPLHQSIPHTPPSPTSTIHPSQNPNPQEISSPVGSSLPLNPSISQMIGNVITSPGTSLYISSRDQTRSPITPGTVHPVLSRLPTPSETSVDPFPDAPEVLTFSMATASTIHNENTSRPSNAAVVSSPRPIITKRRNIDKPDPGGSENQQPKKQKLNDHYPTTEQVHVQNYIPPDTNETARVDAMDVDQDSVDESIEIGLDGLRSEEDCLTVLIDDDDEDTDHQTCVLCKARYDMKYTTDPPKIFARATKEELVLHCSTEHHDAWETLRRNV